MSQGTADQRLSTQPPFLSKPDCYSISTTCISDECGGMGGVLFSSLRTHLHTKHRYPPTTHTHTHTPCSSSVIMSPCIAQTKPQNYAHRHTYPKLPPYLTLKALVFWQPSAEIEANLIYLGRISIPLPQNHSSSIFMPLSWFRSSLLPVHPKRPLSNHANTESNGLSRCLV